MVEKGQTEAVNVINNRAVNDFCRVAGILGFTMNFVLISCTVKG